MAIIKPEQLQSGSYSISGSFSGSFQGDGSGLTGITASFLPPGVGGIYGGNGTVPLNTTASVNGDFTFQGLDEDTRLIVKDGNNGSSIHLFSDGPAGQAGVEFRTQTTNTLLHKIQIAGGDTRYQSNQRDLVFSTSTGSLSSGIFITASNGNVGIGTVTPNYKLDVNGTTNINGNTTITGSIDVLNGNVNITSNANFFEGTSTGGSNVSLIGVSNQDVIRIGNQGFDNLIVDDTTILGDTTITGSVNISGSLIASGLSYPTADQEQGDVLTTDGTGNLTFEKPTIYAKVKNISGGTLPKGLPVHVVSSVGNTDEVIAASASNDATMPATFVLAQQLDDDEEGLGIVAGFINGVNTTGFGEGDIVYVGANGGYTNQKPTGSNLIQNLGIVTKIGANGSGFVYGAGRANDIPNIQPGYVWVGNSDWVATPTPTSSIQNVVSASYALTASYALSSAGGGSSTGIFGITDASGSYTYYSDFQTAINAASAGETVEMFADVLETSAITITLKKGVNINGNGHTYELNTADATPAFVIPNSTANFDIAIQNMIITRSNSTTTAGYCIGIGINTTGDLDLTGTIVNNTGAGYGITAVSANGNMQINNATVYTNSAIALRIVSNSAGGAKNCIAYSVSGTAISNSSGRIVNCFGQSTSGIGVVGGAQAVNCTGVSGGTDGFQNAGRAFKCTGISTGGAGYYSVNSAQNYNCSGYSSASYGFRTLGTSNHIISNCSGYSTANAGMYLSQAVRANNCFAYSTVNNAYGGSGTVNLYNCTGESLAAVTVAGVNDIYNCSLKCSWNNTAGHVINTTNVSLREYFNNMLETTNSSANAIYSLNAQTAYIGSNVYKGMTTPINANITNIQSNTPDAYGNILIG